MTAEVELRPGQCPDSVGGADHEETATALVATKIEGGTDRGGGHDA